MEKGFWAKTTEKVNNAATGASNKVAGAYEASEMYPYFMCLFLIGCLFLFLATVFLPFIVLKPQKTANFVNVGSICILASFGLIRGFY